MQKSDSVADQTRFLVVCDVDSTLINEEVIDELAALLGFGPQVAEITASAMAGEIDFSESLRRRVRILEGLSLDAFQSVRNSLSFTSGAKELVDAVHERGGKIFAVSGGFHEVLDGLGAELGLDGWLANRLSVSEGRTLSGEVQGEIVDATVKARALRQWARDFQVPIEQTIAIGDGANDIQLLEASGLGIAFHAKAALRAVADISLPHRNLAEVISILPGSA